MKKFDPAQLSYFTGTEKYYRISRRHLLTDGTKYLAEEAECFWMMDAIASHLCEIGTADWFVLVRVQVTEGRAVMTGWKYRHPSPHFLCATGQGSWTTRCRRESCRCRRCARPAAQSLRWSRWRPQSRPSR